MVFIALAHWLPVSPRLLYPVRVVVVGVVLAFFSRQLISFRAGNWLGSIGVGIAVFVLWIAPDVLWPAYRSHWLFDNSLVGSARSSVPHEVKSDLVFLVFRIFGSVLLVPVLEELFWRGWLMRWLIRPDFEAVRLGTYTRYSFWVTAAALPPSMAPTGTLACSPASSTTGGWSGPADWRTASWRTQSPTDCLQRTCCTQAIGNIGCDALAFAARRS